MHLGAAFYLAGALTALMLRTPPSPAQLALLALATAAGWAAVSISTASRGRAASRLAALPCAAVAGFAWAALHAGAAVEDRLDAALDGRVLAVAGTVTTFPERGRGALRFTIETAGVAALPRRIAVTWRDAAPAPRLGQWCVLQLRLARPRGFASPGVAARERVLATRGIGAVAHVEAHPSNVCADVAPRYALARVRVALSGAIAAAVPDTRAAAVLRALAVADRGGLDEDQWDVMRATGTGHLLAVSGLHVSLVALWTFWTLRVIASAAFARTGRHSARHAAWVGAAAAAVAYAALAGFGIPARRASVMVVVAALAVCRGRRVLSATNLALAALVVVTLDPLAIVAGGFWLSFAAAAVLVGLSAGRRAAPAGPRARGRAHLALAIGLAPLSALLFGVVSVTAPVANLLAVPLTAIFVVPLTLAGAVALPVFEPAAVLAWNAAANAWSLLWSGLALLGGAVEPWVVPGRLDAVGAGVCLAGLALLGLPRGVPGRGLGAVLLVSAWLPASAPLAPGEFRLWVLDVGQGLAVLVTTRRHALLYDTGPRWWPSGRDAGSAVVLPALGAAGVTRLDRLVVSHGDSDHAGGLASVLAAVPVRRLSAAEAPAVPRAPPFEPCAAPRRWHWDGVRFAVLHPVPDDTGSRNDRSCVLAIAGRGGRVLLPGDAERAAERRLLERDAAALAADVVVVPHHGSDTSSHPGFVRAVAPRFAIVSAGHRNRFGLPDAQVLARYRRAGAVLLDTARDGTVEVRVHADGVDVRGWRARRAGFWNAAGP